VISEANLELKHLSLLQIYSIMHMLRPIPSATQTQNNPTHLNIFLSHLIGYNLSHALIFYDDEINEQIPSNFFVLIKTNPALLLYS
jgi:hypothetical protein